MVKKSAVILGILAMLLALGAGMSWGYTVAKWPAPGIPNTVYCGGSSCLTGLNPDEYTLRGPVAPACEPPLIPGLIHCALSIPFRAAAIGLTPLFTRCPGEECCQVPMDGPAYVTAAVPCTPVNIYIPPRGW
ncbi:MAG: hypothetical protein WBG50_04310 [Desulfomonilaceae bacterium]